MRHAACSPVRPAVTIFLGLALLVAAPAPGTARADEVVPVYSRLWPTGTLAFSRADDLKSCRAALREEGRAGRVCAKGARFWINNGQRVRVAETTDDAATVTIADGPHSGERVVVDPGELDRQGLRARQVRPPPPSRGATAAERAIAAQNALEAHARAAGAAQARCLEQCAAQPLAFGLPQCEDACRAAYQRARSRTGGSTWEGHY